MNRLEELLIILSEECAEVSQAAIKCVRFGMASTHPESPESNKLKLERELGDFLAMFRLLVEEAGIREEIVMEAAEAKLIKVEKFMRNPKGKTPTEMVEALSRNPLSPIPPPSAKRIIREDAPFFRKKKRNS